VVSAVNICIYFAQTTNKRTKASSKKHTTTPVRAWKNKPSISEDGAALCGLLRISEEADDGEGGDEDEKGVAWDMGPGPWDADGGAAGVVATGANK